MGKIIDLTGKKFNMLTVLEMQEKRDSNGRVMWKCQCDCGKITIVKGTAIKSGATKSCGCLQKTKSKEVNAKNIANMRFGYLIALEPTEERDAGSVVWKCQCDCGNIIKVRSTSLRSGHTYSCGCMNESKGELEIKNLLIANKIPFKREVSFPSCVIPETGGFPRFDFYVEDKYLIEFDGK